ncbi:hypothetical protein DUI87_13314 [Hirundo rustica rustica]|uniref:Uncharacterized protein n=1 Tax=Hirundo rustica rustica TaxID=333673 RepID=A0A3M0KBD8_HIRRU|nr:hypothetical protein DUI87_13314 [Hirundo rustica rustica]
MGQEVSAHEKDVFELTTKLLDKHSYSLPAQDLKAMLKWTASQLPEITLSTIFTADLWDNMGDNLRKTTMKGDKTATQLLPSWSVFLEAFKAQEKFHAKDKGAAAYLPSAAHPQSSLQPEETVSLLAQPLASPLVTKRAKDSSKSIGAFAAGYCSDDNEDNEGDPFDSGPVNSEKEPDLYPPDPNPNHTWVHLKQ